MRLSRPLYEGLPILYGALGGCALYLASVEGSAIAGKVAFTIGFCAEIAALTVFLRRQDYRDLSREYTGGNIGYPAGRSVTLKPRR